MEKFEHKLSVKMEDGSKAEIPISVNMAGVALENFAIRGLRDLAANAVKPVRDGTQTVEDFLVNFPTIVEKYSRGESMRQAGAGKLPAMDSRESFAHRALVHAIMVNVLSVEPTKASKEQREEARKQAKAERAANSKRWTWALKEADRLMASKGFE